MMMMMIYQSNSLFLLFSSKSPDKSSPQPVCPTMDQKEKKDELPVIDMVTSRWCGLRYLPLPSLQRQSQCPHRILQLGMSRVMADKDLKYQKTPSKARLSAVFRLLSKLLKRQTPYSIFFTIFTKFNDILSIVKMLHLAPRERRILTFIWLISNSI